MDDLALASDELHGALTGLARINAFSSSARIVAGPILRLARRLPTTRLRVLDIATGAGDVPLGLWKQAARNGVSLEILGIDMNARSLEFARQRAAAEALPVAFECHNALQGDLPTGFDIVMCSLFMHHLSDDDAIELMRRMAAAAKRMVLINDLRRSRYGLLLAYVAGRVLTRSRVVRIDAVRSVRAAFTPREVQELAKQAGMESATIARRWPARMLLTWERAAAGCNQ